MSAKVKSVTVHPRLRGELKHRPPPCRKAFGSSPLTRGTLDNEIKQTEKERFIPAYAGNSNASQTFMVGFPVHPRLRGELGSER